MNWMESARRIQDVYKRQSQYRDGKGGFLFPGAIDTHAHLNDPGYTWREDYSHGTAAAAVGGFTTVDVYKRQGCTLEDYLDGTVFKDSPMTVMQPEPEAVKGYEAFMERYKKGLAAERAAVECLL